LTQPMIVFTLAREVKLGREFWMGSERPVKILFLASEPSNAGRLRLGREFEDIREKLQLAKYGDRFVLESRWAVRPGDITQEIYNFEPQIIHFSGHGTTLGELCFEDLSGKVKTIQPDALAALFEMESNRINCVVLNACYSEIQARAIAAHIPYVVGMNQTIGDKAAIIFAVGFYKAFGAGRTIRAAYKAGCTEMRLEGNAEYLTPVLLTERKDIEDAPKRVKFTLVLTATIDEIDAPLAEAIVEHLSKISEDASLTLKKIQSGSVKLTLEGNQEGWERLQALFKSGQLSEVLNIPVQDIFLQSASSESTGSQSPVQTGRISQDYNQLPITTSGIRNESQYLLIGSVAPFDGKSTVILGLVQQLAETGLEAAYGKPIGTCLSKSRSDNIDEDVHFIAQTLGLSQDFLLPTLLSLDETTIAQRLSGIDQTDYCQRLHQYLQIQTGELVLLEGASTLEEGWLFDLSLPQIAQAINASVVLVVRFHSSLIVEALMKAKQQLGDRFIGVLINDVLPEDLGTVENQIKPFLEKQEIEVLGILPRNDVLRSVRVGELVHQLNAQVLCRADRLDLMVESLKIGAMNVNAALGYFRKGRNMAIVTGGDRTDIQLAALETSTQCLILTGHLPPAINVIVRAEQLEIPVLSVDLDTLTTAKIIDRALGQIRIHEPLKVRTAYQLMNEHFNLERLLVKLRVMSRSNRSLSS